MFKQIGSILMIVAVVPTATCQTKDQLTIGRQALQSRTGCYLVDYSFVETEALKPGYVRDNRVYDVNRDKSIKEWIYADDISAKRIWLQHILFGTDASGKLMEGSILKHTGEDWEYNPSFLYDYAGPLTWNIKSLKDTPDQWVRRVTNLDDGLRYQCAAAWKTTTGYPDWSCTGLAPIPGRETRDMHRKDYNLLDRTSRLVLYGNSWLEREANTKISEVDGKQTPVVKELGKTWYVRLPDAECSVAQEFVVPRRAFWKLVRQAWDEVLTGDGTFREAPPARDVPSRYEQIIDLEEKYATQNLDGPKIAAQAHAALLAVIKKTRAQ